MKLSRRSNVDIMMMMMRRNTTPMTVMMIYILHIITRHYYPFRQSSHLAELVTEGGRRGGGGGGGGGGGERTRETERRCEAVYIQEERFGCCLSKEWRVWRVWIEQGQDRIGQDWIGYITWNKKGGKGVMGRGIKQVRRREIKKNKNKNKR